MKRFFSCEPEKSGINFEDGEKEKVELYLRSKKFCFRRTLFLCLFGIAASAASVLVALYATYVFIHITRIGDISGIHITESVELFLRTAKGNIFNDPQSGISNWMLHRDRQNGFEIAHPEDWIMGDGREHLLEIKKYNSRRSINESLSAVIQIDKLENGKNLSLVDFASAKTGISREMLKELQISGKKAVRTGKQYDSFGLPYSKIFWEKGGNNYCLKVVYYNQQSKDAEADLEKILGNLKLL